MLKKVKALYQKDILCREISINGKVHYHVVNPKRLDSNMDSKSSNNTYLNIVKILFLLYIFYFQ